MSRGVVILISVAMTAIFACLVYYGWTHRWGGAMDTTIQKPLVLAMRQIDESLTLQSSDFDDGIWQRLPALTVPLLHQVSEPPHGRNLVPTVDVRAFHNGKEAYFLFEWKDAAASRTHDLAEFPDGVAVGFSMAKETPSASIVMGFQSSVNIWQWKADLDAQVWGGEGDPRYSPNVDYTYLSKADIPTPAEEAASACQDLVAIRPGTLTLKEKTILSGRGRWRDDGWRVIVKRALGTGDSLNDAQLAPGKMHVTFAVWAGEKGDRGSRKSISEWVVLDVKSASGPALPTSVSVGGASNPPRPAMAGMTFGWPAALAVGPSSAASAADAEPRVINIKAKRFEYMPSKITLQRDEWVTLRLESLDVTHGLYIDGYGIDLKARPGLIGKATFQADKAGRFAFRCSETCGEFHPYMIGYLTVEPNRRYHVFVVVAIAAGVCLLLAASTSVRRKRKEAARNG